jgi:mono/diheme cytochrome c family protein
MPAWGGEGGVLDDEEIDRRVEYLRDLGGVSAPLLAHEELWSRAEPSRGAALYAETCARCHGPDGEGLEGPALSNRVFLETASDGYIAATIRWGRSGTTMEGFATPSVTRRTLSTEEIASIVAHIRSWEVSR